MPTLLLLLATLAHAGGGGDPTPGVCTSTPTVQEGYKPRAAPPETDAPGGWPRRALKRRASPQALRAKEHKRSFKRYPADVQDALLRGELREGLDEVAAYIAWGAPDFSWDRPGRQCRALVYADQGSGAAVVDTCRGRVQTLYDAQAPVDCTRLDAVAPRLDKHRRWFAELELEQQTGVVFGVPAGWMTADDLRRTFGEPVRRMSSADRLVFHDDTGYYEGLTVELEGGLAARWGAPAEQLFTRAGRRQHRKDQRAAERDAWREQQRDEVRQARRQVITTLLVASAAIAAQEIAKESMGGGASAPASSPEPRPAPASSGSGGGGPKVERSETVVPPAVGDPAGSHVLKGWCSAVFQLESVVTVRGGRFTAKSVLTPGPRVTGEVQRSTQSGSVQQDGDAIRFGDFASGMIDITGGLSLVLGPGAPTGCAGQRVIHER